MYCLSLGIKDFKEAKRLIKDFDIAEIRLDLCDFDRRQVKEIFASHDNLIATFRKKEGISPGYRISILKTAIVSGAKWVDIDMDTNSDEVIREIKDFADGYGAKTIISLHRSTSPPDISVMDKYIKKARSFNPALVKIIFYAFNDGDNAKVLSLYSRYQNIIAFNMGEKGKITRIKALESGAPFMYVAPEGHLTAPGQLTVNEVKDRNF